MTITKDILDEYKKITSIDIEAYLTKTLVFFGGGSYTKLSAYYTGQSSIIERGVFTELDELEDQNEIMLSKFHSMKRRLNNSKWWLLLELLELIDSQIQSARNINKWSKSTLGQVSYSPNIQLQYITRSNQPLERISQDILKSSTPTDSWFDIAQLNHLKEEDYDTDGGKDLTLDVPRLNALVNVTSVVDVMTGKNILGKDFDKALQFDNEDLKILSPDDTVHQAVEILANLRKNDHPDYPSEGLQSNIVVGSNRAVLNFPVITRQFSDTFATDDTLQNFSIKSITVEADVLNIAFEVETILGNGMDAQVNV